MVDGLHGKYKQLASIYRVFLYETTSDSINPVEIADSRCYVVECLIFDVSNAPIKLKLIEKYNSEEKSILLLIIKNMV